MKLEVEDFRFSYGREEILKGISLQAESGLTTIIGPNGAGKSTFVKCLAGVLKPSSGAASFGGENLLTVKGMKTDVRMAYMPQEQPHFTSLSVLEVVLLGRVRELGLKVNEKDIDTAYGSLERLNLEEFAKRPFNELSGGQSQMVMIAQCLASEPDFIILDEPINNLDIRRELEMFEVMDEITRKDNLTTLMILHDINMASKYSDNLAVFREGEMHSFGKPADIISEEMLRDVYGIEAHVEMCRGVPRIDPLCACKCQRRKCCGGDVVEIE